MTVVLLPQSNNARGAESSRTPELQGFPVPASFNHSTEELQRLTLLGKDNLRFTMQIEPKPLVKVCVLSTGKDIPVSLDVDLILRVLHSVPNINPDHIASRIYEQLDSSFDKFFDPTDISEGGMLILIVSGHGFRDYSGNHVSLEFKTQDGHTVDSRVLDCNNHVSLEFKTQDGRTVDSRVLQQKIMGLPQSCTLEVVADTCCAEGIIPGLHRILSMHPSAPSGAMAARLPRFVAMHAPPSGSRLNTMVPASSPSYNVEPSVSFSAMGSLKHAEPKGQDKYKAQVIVWAASTGWGSSFTEEDLPGKPGVYSILIGAIFSYLSSHGLNVNRRDLWENVYKVVEQHNYARRVRDLGKTPKRQAKLANRTQSAVLLTSVDNTDYVLNGRVFQPI
ncbi:unnamed protein product [Rhizoctonia solani]|uniref:Uncharacterized protein n=1 Tax=Rhizoctonia solani TaxID=456999 RepID=A0A8H3GVS6_9AGAM|nr:unnamed protein product [Rhizoctonia solani]